MQDKRKREFKENLDKVHKVVLQSRAGANAISIAKETGVHRSPVHNYLNTLELAGKVYSEHVLWFAKLSEKEEVQEPREGEADKARALQIMKSIPGLQGANVLTRENWDYFNHENGKPKLDKARALLIRKSTEAPIG